MTTAENNTTAVLDENATAVLSDQVQPQPETAQPETAQPETIQPVAVQPNATFSITSFVLGVVSIVAGWSFVAPIVGLVLGIIALRRKSPERTLALWGVWLNGAMLAISTLFALGFLAVLAAGFFGSAFYGSWGY